MQLCPYINESFKLGARYLVLEELGIIDSIISVPMILHPKSNKH